MHSSYQTRLKSMPLARSWLVVMVISLFFFYEFGLGNAFNTLTPAILQEYPTLNAVNVSFISSLYFYTNIGFMLISAPILDRYSSKHAIAVALSICSLSVLIFAYTHNVYVLGFARLLMGLGASFSLVGCVRIATNWFPADRLGFVIGIIIAIGMLGGYAAQAPVGYLLDALGLKGSLIAIGLIGFAIVFLIMVVVHNAPFELREMRKAQARELKGQFIFKTILTVLKNPQNIYCSLYVGLINIGTWMLGGMWSNTYLIKTQGVSVLEARSITGFIFIGMIFAYPFWGWLTERLQRRKTPLILGALGSLIVILIMMLFSVNAFGLSVIYFMLGFMTSAQTVAYPLAGEINPMKNNAVATSLVSMNSLFWGGIVAMPLFGILTEKFNMAMGYPSDAAAGLNFGMGILLIGFILSIMIAFLVKETYCKRQVE